MFCLVEPVYHLWHLQCLLKTFYSKLQHLPWLNLQLKVDFWNAFDLAYEGKIYHVCFVPLVSLEEILCKEGKFRPTMLPLSFLLNSPKLLFKVGLSPSKKILCYLLDWKPLRSYEKYLLFHLKTSFSSQGIYVFVTTFWSYRKNGFIRRISLTSQFMTS